MGRTPQYPSRGGATQSTRFVQCTVTGCLGVCIEALCHSANALAFVFFRTVALAATCLLYQQEDRYRADKRNPSVVRESVFLLALTRQQARSRFLYKYARLLFETKGYFGCGDHPDVAYPKMRLNSS